MCSEINIIVLLSLLVLSGCQTPNIEDTSSEAATDFSIEEPMQLTSIDTYGSLSELETAFSIASTSNARAIFSDERIYYLADDNQLGLSLKKINVRESYFNCVYDNEVLLITNRVENGNVDLEVMVGNNPETFTKSRVGDLEYYYIYEDNCNYYFWMQDGYSLQLNVPDGLELMLSSVVDNLIYMEIN
ncbi:MAG: hypothetical protein HFG71_06510 [Hungatella sp.]|nr:hypothetical protein [Hungatella sp.]